MNDEQTNFKVTDRRLFNADGTPRETAPEEEAQPTPTSTPSTASAAAPAAEATSPERGPTTSREAAASTGGYATEEDELNALDDPAGFVNFVMSIASNAASSLGMMEHPVTHSREVNLEVAKHWIDVLGMLETKTRNNLLQEEARILEGLLADLRMQYVSLSGSAKTNPSRPLTGRDIVGG